MLLTFFYTSFIAERNMSQRDKQKSRLTITASLLSFLKEIAIN